MLFHRLSRCVQIPVVVNFKHRLVSRVGIVSHRYAPIYTGPDAKHRADACRSLTDATARGEVRLCALARGQYPGRQLPRGGLPGLKSIGYWDAHTNQSWGLDWHRNEGLELTFCETGKLGFAVDSYQCVLSAMDFTITRPWQLHRVGSPLVTAGRLHWVILDVGVRRPNQHWRWPSWLVLARHDMDELTDLLRHNERPVWPGETLYHCFKRMSDALNAEPAERALSLLAVGLNELFLLVLNLLREQSAPRNPSLSKTRRVVQLFLQDLAINPTAFAREWTVEGMAESCGLGKSQFVNYCRQLTNVSPARYLQQCRLEAAAKWLQDRANATITDIAFGSGFTSSQYFATRFQKHFGCSPSEYRQAACGIAAADRE